MNQRREFVKACIKLKKVAVQKWAVAVGVLLLAGICFVTPIVQASSNNSDKTLKAKSIQIEAGDSLWSIAEQNYSDEFGSIESYINEIMRCNNISSDTIHAGKYLIVPYYQ